MKTSLFWPKSWYGIVLLLLSPIPQLVWAQQSSLFIPLEMQQAYQANTRTKTGKPGPNYWQNHADYTMKVSLAPPDRMLHGEASITYYNESPDTLQRLVLRLYQDRLKKGNLRDEPADPADLHDGVQIKKLVVNGKQMDVKGLDDASGLSAQRGVFKNGTNLIVRLAKPLLPKQSVQLQMDWSLPIPKTSDGRTERTDSTAYFVAYWYPQVAVYDDVYQWDMLNYTGQQEFYNDFNNYQVEVTVPPSFLVWATGEWQNPSELLQSEYLKRYTAAGTADGIVSVVTAKDLKKGNIVNGKGHTTWKFKASYVPDFSFAVSNHYLWDATSAVTDASGKRVRVNALYNRTSKDFYEVARISQQVISYLSSELPGVPYPYPHMTVYNGKIGGGMEFPMMVNDQSSGSVARAISLTAHEIAHTYFPFYMGINERKYAWMDEGWAMFLEQHFTADYFNHTSIDSAVASTVQMYAGYSAGREMDMPMMIPSNQLNGFSYSMTSYMRSSVAYQLLRDLLGPERFKQALQEYMNRWHGKHPTPYDFFFTFNEVANEDLSWFWKPWFFDQGYPDLALDVTKQGNVNTIIVENKGTLPVPVVLQITFADGTQERIYESAAVWKTGSRQWELKKNDSKAIRQITLGALYVPDVNPKDNAYRAEKTTLKK